MYANTFFKQENHDYGNFFNNYKDSEKLLSIKKELNKLNKKVEETLAEYVAEQNKSYNSEFTSCNKDLILMYESRYNNTTLYFDLITGVRCDENINFDNSITYYCNNKSGNASFIVGYAYNLGAVIKRVYRYAINSTNTKVKVTLIKEYIVPIFEGESYVCNYNGSKIDSISPTRNISSLDMNASEFLSTFFGQERKVNFSLMNAKNYFYNNKSAEIIFRTALKEEEMNCLMGLKCEKAMPIHTMLGIKQEEYEKISKDNLVEKFISAQGLFSSEEIKKVITKTNPEIIELLEKMKGYEEDLNFYGIGYRNNLLSCLVNYYVFGSYNSYSSKYNKIKDLYPFGKFCSYVVNESINQGFTSVENFLQKLIDYLRMCDNLNITPTLYSSYLVLTHDITSRNHKIKVTQEQEELFAEKYKEFKTYKGKNYIIVAPKNIEDIKEEGDVLNHCVASYIKRILDNECLIFFMRSANDIEKRLITVEVKNNTVCQARGLHDRDITFEEKMALIEFAKKEGYKVRL